MTKNRIPLRALSVALLLAFAAIAVPVAAEEDDQGDSPREAARKEAAHRREMAKDEAEHRREMAKDEAEHRREMAKERCFEAQANESLNRSAERDCMKVGEFAEKAFKARRAAHALLGAINATERQWAKLNATEARLEARLASGNVSANETAHLEKRLERIDAKQERLADRLERLRERLAGLHERWEAVREHVAEQRAKHREDDDDEEDGSSSSSSSSSSSGSESSSSSSSESSSESSSSPPA